MTTTLTIRLEKKARQAVKKMAAMAGVSESAYLRRLIERDMAKPSMAERTGPLAGTLTLPTAGDDEMTEHLRRQNWRL